ncbi:hypothetical protein [Pseudovibrio sp. SPO723]|uniref:hypothetical protein n=1 Tax=Nesiotobacter zosterae TaxID=392721 RepID=UPI0029C19D9B|nr:hypothetical protein [Pseudovibrio sp. SPO723]MDX5592594.1 hypothetical protein [Pseudovibrio sp. SPO723]
MLKYFVSWLAGFCKGTFFYAEGIAEQTFPKKFFDQMTEEERKKAAIWLQGCCMIGVRNLRPGQEVTSNIKGLSHKGRELGDFKVTIERVS